MLLVCGVFCISSFVFSKQNARLIRLRSDDWCGHCIIFHFTALRTSWVAFVVCFGSCHLHQEVLSAQLCCNWLNQNRKHIPSYFQIYPPASPRFYRYGVLWIGILNKPSLYFLLFIILEQVDLSFISPKKCCSRYGQASLDSFWQSLIWPFYFLTLSSGFHLLVTISITWSRWFYVTPWNLFEMGGVFITRQSDTLATLLALNIKHNCGVH